MEQEVLFDFLADRFGQDKPADSCRAESEHGFIKSPRGDNTPREDI